MSISLIKFIKFGLVGCTGLIIDFLVTWICKEKLKWNKYLANVAGLSFGVINNYFLNKYFTFQDNNTHIGLQFISFLAVSLVGFLFNNLFLYLFQKYTKLNFYICKGVVTIIVFFWNFSINTLYTFNK